MLATACAAPPEEPAAVGMVERYFAENNAAARSGPAAQQEFFRRTQHPDFTDLSCDLGDTAVELDPAMSTLRPDPGYAPDGVAPRGEVWVVGVEVTTRTAGTVTGHQIGSQHLVVLDGRLRGFAPCPNG
ncbi:hypothetical protein SAMN02982929_05356 [Saccharopolyspora kobensis]|uniref:Nuclear transport factor 2 family protein n=1 Tax=Saccharopolyspora kobensis TaxID=146035 RepID=A0A1H6E188_9PSEU|nr:hypothetical protein [Saccharopolyspora kobensis]SEG90944.1 hypothetical protein SAMN02982929_05356 [Saccharopolyspora kobensis]SFD94982.1 hypothetical protein SAMN05216506_107332 [Saccharopolyspora kobensis]